MRTTLQMMVLAVVFSFPAFAQTSDEFNKNEFYAGYLNRRSDAGVFDNGAQGFNAGYTRNFSKYFGLRGEVAGTYKNRNVQTTSIGGTVNFDTKSSVYTFHGGVQVKNNSRTAKIKPFAHALVGVANERIDFNCSPTSNCMPTFSFQDSAYGLSGGFGGGLDVRVNDKIDIRLFQAEFNPTGVRGYYQKNLRFGFGIVIK